MIEEVDEEEKMWELSSPPLGKVSGFGTVPRYMYPRVDEERVGLRWQIHECKQVGEDGE